MIQAMYNGVSGLRAHKTQMDVISNNIANINTIGFKSSRINFREMFNQTIKGASAPKAGGLGGVNPAQIGLGVSVATIDVNQTQGPLQPTGKPTDVAIEGNGYLVLSDGYGKAFSRDGSMVLDSEGNLVSAGSGMKVLGWTANPTTGLIDTMAPITTASGIRLPLGQLALARQTNNMALAGNLNASAVPGSNKTISAQVYDSLGVAHSINIAMTKTSAVNTQGYANTDTATLGTGNISLSVGSGAPTTITLNATNNTLQGLCDAINASGANVTAEIVNSGTGANPYTLKVTSSAGTVTMDSSNLVAGGGTVPSFSNSPESKWVWTASSADAASGSSVGSGVITFGEGGKSTTASGSLSLTLANSNGATSPINIALDLNALTQYEGDSNVSPASQDGLPLGTLDSFTIGKDGVISGAFTNGMNQALARICLAQFSNPAGLSKAGNNLLLETSNSGLPQIGEPSVGSMGKVTSGFLESSNVDLPTEFANMIVSQRGFQANSRIITTSDEILQDLVQLKR